MRSIWFVSAGVTLSLSGGVLAAMVMQPPSVVTAAAAVRAFRAQPAPVVSTSARHVRNPAKTTAHRSSAQARAITTAPVTGAPVAPEAVGLVPAQPGVYSFTTSGSERVDKPSKASHTYPAQSFATATGSPCDASLAWTPIEGRRLALVTCYDHGTLRLKRIETSQTFFGYHSFSAYDCGNDAVAMPAKPTTGTSWRFVCTNDKSVGNVQVDVLEQSVRNVHGVLVRTRHIHFVSTMTGSTRGTLSFDYWFSTKDGLPIQWNSATDVHEDTPFGAVHYVEQFSLALQNLKPQT